jgi:hypothetical protein
MDKDVALSMKSRIIINFSEYAETLQIRQLQIFNGFDVIGFSLKYDLDGIQSTEGQVLLLIEGF